ncbi:helicase associated domain-containing protein [Streptomyces rubiginosohelvolus]
MGAWINNQRSRAATLTPQRIEQLSTIGMRWAKTQSSTRPQAHTGGTH